MTMASTVQESRILLDQTTKHFCKHLKGELQTFCLSISGIPDAVDRTTYALFLLQRLLVLYFLQQHLLLDKDPYYLHNRLLLTQQRLGHDAFYRHFLLPLFHTQLSQSPDEVTDEFGRIPCLAHPLFQLHPQEHCAEELQITDQAFLQLFTFFDQYCWQLDEQTTADTAVLQPVILSHIFEQQINQKAAGAYYTQRDVTDYIAINTLVPYLLATIHRLAPTFLAVGAPGWQLLQRQPERYLSNAINTEYALTDETEREYTTRRARSTELQKLLSTGTVQSIDKLITYNLDMRRFVLDLLYTCQDEQVLQTFYTVLEQTTVLDPTCGTGEFLLAAQRLLEILYTTCWQRLQTIRGQSEPTTILPLTPEYESALYIQQGECAKQIHCVRKRIIQRHLHGVELMREASDICQLRLYLTLLASTKEIADVDPFSTLNMHIITGNALVGHIQATENSIQRNLPATLNRSNDVSPTAHNKYLQEGKKNINFVYRKEATQQGEGQPLHWYRAFPEAMARGGFDVIIGNPPFVEHNKVKYDYIIAGYEEKSCGNLYAAVIARALRLCRSGQSYLGLIVPLSISGSTRFTEMRQKLTQETSRLWLANFEIFPCRLFAGAFQRLSILIAQHGQTAQPMLFSTKIQRWYSAERLYLIDQLLYTHAEYKQETCAFPKLASAQQAHILKKMEQKTAGKGIADYLQDKKTGYFVYYQEATNYWLKATCRIPFYCKNGVIQEPAHGRLLYFATEETARTIMAIMNSSLFYIWFSTYSDGFHLAHALVKEFPLDEHVFVLHALAELACTLEEDIQLHTKRSTRNTKSIAGTGKQIHTIELEEYQMSRSKVLLDKIDCLLASYYGFTQSELDFITNYDIKYRMGR